MLAIAWIILIAVRCTDWPSARVVLHLAAALITAVLAKATTPVYCFLPCLYIGFVLIRKPLRQGWKSELRSFSGRALIFSIGAITPLTAMWYAVNLKTVLQHMRNSSSGEIALDYGFRASVGRKMVVWLGLLDQSFLAPYLGWVVVLAVVIGLVARYGPAGRRSLPPAVRATAVLSALQIGLLLLVFSSNDAVESRYMYPMLVFLAVIVMTFCAPIQSRAAFVAMFALCGLQFAVVHRVALGAAGPLASQFPYLTKTHADPGQYREVERVIRMTSTVTGRYNIIGVEEPWLNLNTASFFAAKHRLDTGIRSYYTSLGYAEKDVTLAVKRVEQFNPMYYITLDERSQPVSPNFLNMASLPMLRHVRTDPRFEQVSASNTTGVLVFRRH
jgi:hypothetical protein